MESKLNIIIENCPQKDFEAPKINYEKCINCGKCSNFCPKKALVLS